MAPTGAHSTPTTEGAVRRLLGHIPWSLIFVVLQCACGLLLSLAGQAMDMHSPMQVNVVFGRYASSVPLARLLSVPIWSTAVITTALTFRQLLWYRLSVLYLLPLLHILELAKGWSWAFDPEVYRFHLGFIVIVTSAVFAAIYSHAASFWDAWSIWQQTCEDPLMSVDWNAVIASNACSSEAASDHMIWETWPLSAVARGPLEDTDVPATVTASPSPRSSSWSSIYSQAYTKGLFEKKVAPASAVPGPTSGTTDTARLSFTNPADDSSSSGLSPGIASAHPGAAPTSHEGAPVPSTNALIAPAATPTAHGATPSTPGGNDMTPGGAANVVSVLTPGTHTMSFKAGLAAISRTASATPSSFVTTGAPTAAAAAAIGGDAADNMGPGREVTYTSKPRLLPATVPSTEVTLAATSNVADTKPLTFAGTPADQAVSKSAVEVDNDAGTKASFRGHSEEISPADAPFSIPAIRTAGQSNDLTSPSATEESITVGSIAGQQWLPTTTKAGLPKAEPKLGRQGSSGMTPLQRARSELKEVHDKFKARTARRGNHANHDNQRAAAKTASGVEQGNITIKEKLRRTFSPRSRV